MDSTFCCSSIEPFRPRIIETEAKFNMFLNWARTSEATSTNTIPNLTEILSSNNYSCFVVQLARQVNYGPLESKRYFAKTLGMGAVLTEVTEQDLINANYEKLNSYKNFKCVTHNKFFELNLYQRDPVNRHHWRANIARPAADIDLTPKPTSASESA